MLSRKEHCGSNRHSELLSDNHPQKFWVWLSGRRAVDRRQMKRGRQRAHIAPDNIRDQARFSSIPSRHSSCSKTSVSYNRYLLFDNCTTPSTRILSSRLQLVAGDSILVQDRPARL